MTLHIGIAGPIGSGKSYLARELKTALTLYGRTVEIVPMAAAMKELTETMAQMSGGGSLWQLMFATAIFQTYGYTPDDAMRAGAAVADAYDKYYTPNEKPRKFLQVLGTEIGREMLDPDIWVKRVRAKKNSLNVDYVITDDIRFMNEALSVDYLMQIDVLGADAPVFYQRNTHGKSTDYLDTNHRSEEGLTLTQDFPVPYGIITCGQMEKFAPVWAERIDSWLFVS